MRSEANRMQSNILKIIYTTLAVGVFSAMAQSQPAEPRMSKQEYIERYKEQAIREMHASGVPASITLAQGMLESDYGNSPLAKYANNHFGIKCHKEWTGPTFIQDDDEENECFRKYYSVYDSYRDHSEFLRTRDRYASLFELKTTDYKGWAHGLKKAGYATNPRYADLLIRIIEENKLYEYDRIIKLPEEDTVPALAERHHKPQKPATLTVRHFEVSENNIKYVRAEKGDTPESIAKRYNLGTWQVLKYNDFSKHQQLLEGDVVYLQPKRNHAAVDYHVVKPGDTLHSISQKYGVKIKRIMKLNDLEKDARLNPGDTLILRKIGPVNEFLTGR